MKFGRLRSLAGSHHSALVCLLLAAATLAVYWRVLGFDFTNYDDDRIIGHPMVVSGLTLRGFFWALTTFYYEYWHPLMWLSHMLDCQLFGLRAGGHHLVSLGFHVANTLLLFVVLQRMTGAWKRSGLVAALFALHPLHVESVAWVAERKDVLSGFFFMLTLWAYCCYAGVRRPDTESTSRSGISSSRFGVRLLMHNGPPSSASRRIWYWAAVALFALGLMCKPVLMTLPFVLLLLDYWPLERSSAWKTGSADRAKTAGGLAKAQAWAWLVAEKAPFFLLTAGSCAITYAWARHTGTLLAAGAEPWDFRLANVPVSCARYLGKLFWPADLFLPYLPPHHWAWWQTGGAVLLLVVITLFAVRRARSAPYLIVGWLFFLGMLVPTIRLVHTGHQSIADRYTYIPSIGIFLAVVWAAAEWGGARSRARLRLGCGAGAVALLLCGYLTWGQVGIWRNSLTLWTHCLAVCPDNHEAHNHLGRFLARQGKLDEAIVHYQTALKLKSDYPLVEHSLGIALLDRGRADEAIACFKDILRRDPGNALAGYFIGQAFLQQGNSGCSSTSPGGRSGPSEAGPFAAEANATLVD